jgi:hypothetical protein
VADKRKVKDNEMSTPYQLLPVEAVNGFARELESHIEVSTERLAIFMSSANDIKNSNDEMKQLASMVVTSYKKMLADIDEQLTFWLSLELTQKQQQAVQHCQSLALKLHHIQALFEQNDPMNEISLQ